MYLGISGKLLLKTFNLKVLIPFYLLYCLNMDNIHLSKLSSKLSISEQKKECHIVLLKMYHVYTYIPKNSDSFI